jgi:hypothetical protein
MLKMLFLSAATTLSLPVFGQTVRCENAHGDLSLEMFKQTYRSSSSNGFPDSINDALSHLETRLRAGVLVGNETPSWSDYEILRYVVEEMKKGTASIRATSGEAGVQKFYQELNQAYSKYNRNRQLQQARQRPQNSKYGPIEYGLKAAFRSELEKLNRLLPSQMRFQLAPLPKDDNKQELVKQGEQIVTELESSVRSLYPTTGYKNVVELVETIRDKGNAQVKENLEHLMNEDFEFAIARPENARWWVPKVGFHNQYVTGSSKGFMGHKGRNATEATKIGVTLDDYENQDNDLKPKYGWLIPKIDSGFLRQSVHYGTDIFILDKAKLRKRTTWTPSDSLNAISRFIPNWMKGEVKQPTEWEHFFVPWSQRAILAPMLADPKAQSLAAKPADGGRWYTDGTYSIGEGAPPLKRPFGGTEYIELQYWGPLTLNEVKAFAFQGLPPAGEFLEELLKRKIPIYKIISSKEYQKWEPGAAP